MKTPYPSQVAYQDALQNPALCFALAELRALVPLDKTPYGLPAPITGQFANVYRMGGSDGKAWAIKLFLRSLPERLARYDALAAHRAALAPVPDWFTPFVYHEAGIRVGGATFPVLQMPWLADAVPLNFYVDAVINTPNAVEQLRGAWRVLVEEMETARFAHGDLQHGNILVSIGEGGTPRFHLLDYDGSTVPTLAGTLSGEGGHPAYQHPRRTTGEGSLTVDRFAAIAVDAALTILAEAPELWYRFDNGDNLLWRREDFAETRAPGRALSALTQSPNAVIRRAAASFRAVCESPVSLVPPLDRFAFLMDSI
ncbi:MAG: hypothetical protein H7Y38_07580 [Armatimonadetes bacterium]|nr:hypothetical protein [Armatimonadota bacterium]